MSSSDSHPAVEPRGCLALVGGGEFSFGETQDVDRAWIERAGEGPVGFLPTASGSADYGRNFAGYLAEAFDRSVELIPVYRPRDARRNRNVERIASSAAVYIGGGVVDDLLEVLAESPAASALDRGWRDGRSVIAIAGAAQALGSAARGLRGDLLPGLGWLPDVVVEPNFTPAHDRRLREAQVVVAKAPAPPADEGAADDADGDDAAPDGTPDETDDDR